MFHSSLVNIVLRKQICELYWNERKDIKEISVILKMSYLRVYQYLTRKTREYTPKKLRPRFNKTKQVNISHLLFDLGFSKPHIAKYLNVSPSAVYAYLSKENVQGGIVKVEIELMQEMHDEYEPKVIIPSGNYILYPGVNKNCLMVRNANNKGRCYFVNRDKLIGNFQITIGGEVLRPC